MRELLGRTVQRIRLEKNGEHFLVFETDQGPLAYQTDGDCCSESWFSDFTGVDAMLSGRPVTAVSELQNVGAPDGDGRSRQDSDIIYGWAFEIGGAGTTRILFRNSSNGWYGGDCSLVLDVPTGETRDVVGDLMV